MKKLVILLVIIMFTPIINSVKVCPKTRIINMTGSWTKNDQKILEHSKERCGQIYKNSPCVKLFKKMDINTYQVICGGYKK